MYFAFTEGFFEGCGSSQVSCWACCNYTRTDNVL